MNAERLHAVVIALQKELRDHQTVKKMESLVNSLRAVVAASNSSTQQALASSRTDLYEALRSASSDKFSPMWKELVRQLGGDGLFGQELKTKIEEHFETNQITPAVALSELEKELKALEAFSQALDDTAGAFGKFRIGSERLGPGQSEIGVLVPRQEVDNKLLEFAGELKELGFIMNTFAEVATGRPDDLHIKGISSTELMIFLEASPTYAACLAVAVERVVALYKQLLEIRKLHQQLNQQGVPEEKTTGITQHANSVMEEGITKASVEIVQKFYVGKDKARKNELTTRIVIAMNKIANRIDHGFNFEVRVEPPTAGQLEAKDESLQKSVEMIQAASANMQFLKLEGQPVLRLPEGERAAKAAAIPKNRDPQDNDSL